MKLKIISVLSLTLMITLLYFNASSTSSNSIEVNPSYILRQTDSTINFVIDHNTIQTDHPELKTEMNSSSISPIKCMSPVDGSYSSTNGKRSGADYNPLSCFYAMEVMTAMDVGSGVGTALEVGWDVITARPGEAIRDTKDSVDCKYSREEEKDDDVKKWRIYFGWGVTKINWNQKMPAAIKHSNQTSVNNQRASNIDYSRVTSDLSCNRTLTYSSVVNDKLNSVCNNVSGVVDSNGSGIVNYDPEKYQFFDLSTMYLGLDFTTRFYAYCDNSLLEGCPNWLQTELRGAGYRKNNSVLNLGSSYDVWYKDVRSTVGNASVEGHSLHEISSNSIKHVASYIENMSISNYGVGLKVADARSAAGVVANKVNRDYRFCGSNYHSASTFNRLSSTKAGDFMNDHFEHFSSNSIQKVIEKSTNTAIKTLPIAYSETYAEKVDEEKPNRVTEVGDTNVEITKYKDQHISGTKTDAGNTQRYLHDVNNSLEGTQACLPITRLAQATFTDDFYSSLNGKEGTLYQQGFNKYYLQEQMSYLFEKKNICNQITDSSRIPCPITGNSTIDMQICPIHYGSIGLDRSIPGIEESAGISPQITTSAAKMYIDVTFSEIPYFNANWIGSGITDTSSNGVLHDGSSGYDPLGWGGAGTYFGRYDEATAIYPGIGLKAEFENLNNQRIKIDFKLRSENAGGAGFHFADGTAYVNFSMLYRFLIGQCDYTGMELEKIDWDSFEILNLTLNPLIDPNFDGAYQRDAVFLNAMNVWITNHFTNSNIEADIKLAILSHLKNNYRLALPFKGGGYIDSEVSDNGDLGIIHILNLNNMPKFTDAWDCPDPEEDSPDPEEDIPSEYPDVDLTPEILK